MQTFPNLIENPHFKALIDGFADITQSCSAESLDTGRRRCTEFFLSKSSFRIEVASIQDKQIPKRDQNQIPLRIYDPAPSENLPVVVYFHRGGWVFGNNERDHLLHVECLFAIS